MHRVALIAFALVAAVVSAGVVSAEAPVRFRQRTPLRFAPQRPNGRFARLEEAPAQDPEGQQQQQPGDSVDASSVGSSDGGYHYPKPMSSGYNYPKPDQAFPLPGEQPAETESTPTEAPTTPGSAAPGEQEQVTTTVAPGEDYDDGTAAPAVDDSLDEATTVASADATNAKLRRRQQLVNPIRYTQLSQRLEQRDLLSQSSIVAQPLQPVQRAVYLINLPESALQQLLLLNSPLVAQPTPIQLAPEPGTVLLSELDYVYKKKRSVY